MIVLKTTVLTHQTQNSHSSQFWLLTKFMCTCWFRNFQTLLL